MNVFTLDNRRPYKCYGFTFLLLQGILFPGVLLFKWSAIKLSDSKTDFEIRHLYSLSL